MYIFVKIIKTRLITGFDLLTILQFNIYVMKKNIFLFLFAAFTVAAISCSDDNNINGENEQKSELTPDECKARMDQIGQKAIGKVNTNAHKDLLVTIDRFCEFLDYGNIDIERDVTKAAKAFSESLKNIVAKNRLDQVSKLSSENSELYALTQYYGIYTYNESKQYWDFEYSDNSLEFHFDVDGSEAVIKASANGKETNYTPYPDYEVKVPENAEADVTLGGKQLASVKINFNVNDTEKSVKINAKIDASGYVFSQDIDVNKQNGSSLSLFTINGEQMVRCTANISGNNMTDPDNIENSAEGNGEIQDLFNNAKTEVVIMNDATIKAECSNIKNFVDELNKIDEDYTYYDEYEEEYNKKICDTYNKYLSVKLFYNDRPNELVANLGMDLDFDEGRYYVYYDYEKNEWIEKQGVYDYTLIITFANDNSKYDIESYFDEDYFSKLIDDAEDLADRYESFFRYL